MSEEVQKTPEEIQAGIDKVLAEAEQAKADAERARADARKANAEAEDLEIMLARKRHDREVELAKDEYHHVYRFNTSVNGKSVQDCVTKLTEWHRADPTCDIEIIFNSPGGDVINGMALFDYIQELRDTHKITTGASGMAASMAGILLQAGDVRWVGEQSWVLIHRISFGIVGSAYEVEDELEFVKRIEKRVCDIFAARTKLTPTRIKKNWDRKDWWISADEALELGIVDEVRGPLKESRE